MEDCVLSLKPYVFTQGRKSVCLNFNYASFNSRAGAQANKQSDAAVSLSGGTSDSPWTKKEWYTILISPVRGTAAQWSPTETGITTLRRILQFVRIKLFGLNRLTKG